MTDPVTTGQTFEADGYLRSVTGYWNSGYGPTGYTEGFATGSTQQVGPRNFISERVTSAGVYGNGFDLREAVVTYRQNGNQFTADAFGGLFAPTTLFGRYPVIGAGGVCRADRVSASAFAGRPQSDAGEGLLYGGGLSAGETDGPNSLLAGVDFMGEGSGGVPDVAVSSAMTYAPARRGAVSLGAKAFLDPSNSFSIFNRLEAATSAHVGSWLQTYATLFHEGAQSDDLFSGLPTTETTTVRGGVRVQPLSLMGVQADFGKGTYLIDDERVAVVLNLGSIKFQPYYHNSRPVIFEETLDSRDYGAVASLDLKNIASIQAALSQWQGDPLPIFDDKTTEKTLVLLKGRHDVSGKMSLWGNFLYDVREERIVSGQIVFEVRLGKEYGNDDDRREAAEQAVFRWAPLKDPLVKSLLSPIIYPEQKIPSTTTMNHREMLDGDNPFQIKMLCKVCHDTIREDGRMGLPPAVFCQACHPPLKAIENFSYDPASIEIPHSYTKFKHQYHVEDAATATDETCLVCHPTIPEATLATREDLPSMNLCLETCHDQPHGEYPTLNQEIMAKRGYKYACSVCHHETDANEKMITRTRAGTLYPRNPYGYLGAITHDPRENWYEMHGAKGRQFGEWCEACHSPSTESACNQCHGTSVDAVSRPPSHGPLWADVEHYRAWMTGDRACVTCHGSNFGDPLSVCRDCHDKRGLTANVHHTGDWRCDLTQENPVNDHQLHAGPLCLACHDADIQTGASGRKALSCTECHGAENFGSCR